MTGKKLSAEPISRRTYYLAKSVLSGADWFAAMEAISSTAIEHPEWDMDEIRTWDEWEKA